MDVIAVLREVETWSVEDRIVLVRRLRDRLLDEGHDPDLSDELKAELDRRLDEDEAAPAEVVGWEDVKAQALQRSRR